MVLVGSLEDDILIAQFSRYHVLGGALRERSCSDNGCFPTGCWAARGGPGGEISELGLHVQALHRGGHLF